MKVFFNEIFILFYAASPSSSSIITYTTLILNIYMEKVLHIYLRAVFAWRSKLVSVCVCSLPHTHSGVVHIFCSRLRSFAKSLYNIYSRWSVRRDGGGGGALIEFNQSIWMCARRSYKAPRVCISLCRGARAQFDQNANLLNQNDFGLPTAQV